MRRTIRIEVTDVEQSDDPFAQVDRESATLVREFVMTMGYDLSPAEVVDKIRGWLDNPPVAGIRLPDAPARPCPVISCGAAYGHGGPHDG